MGMGGPEEEEDTPPAIQEPPLKWERCCLHTKEVPGQTQESQVSLFLGEDGSARDSKGKEHHV